MLRVMLTTWVQTTADASMLDRSADVDIDWVTIGGGVTIDDRNGTSEEVVAGNGGESRTDIADDDAGDWLFVPIWPAIKFPIFRLLLIESSKYVSTTELERHPPCRFNVSNSAPPSAA